MQNKLEEVRQPKEEKLKVEMDFLLKGLVFCLICDLRPDDSEDDENFVGRYKAFITKADGADEAPIGRYYCSKHSYIVAFKEPFESQVIEKANQFFGTILSSFIHKISVDTEASQQKIFTRIEREFREIKVKLEESIGEEINQVIAHGSYSDLPYAIRDKFEKFVSIKSSYEKMRNLRIDSIERIQEIDQLKENFPNLESVLTDDLDPPIIKELLNDIIQGIYVSGNKKAKIIFKHPFTTGIGGE